MQPQRPRQRRLGCPSRRTDRKRKKPNKLAAVVQAVVMLASFFAGVAVQAWLPWQELPLRWVLLAVALNTAFFIAGHECVHHDGTWQ
jgi:fatty acid desaturase